jgi:hypothetical protein
MSDTRRTAQRRERSRARKRGQRRSPGGLSPRDLQQLEQLPQAEGIRIRTRRDGFGAQYLAQISALCWAIENNRYFFYQRFSYLDHGEDAAKMSNFTGLRSWGEPVHRSKLAHVRFVPSILKAAQPSQHISQRALEVIRDMYHSSPKPSACKHTIAIHMRRGDISKQMKSRWMSEKVYIQLIKTLRTFFPGHTIGIYSQGSAEDFSRLTQQGAFLELNRDLRETFHELATAPLLFPAPSCLSYAAAIVSEGTVVHIANQQHQPLEHWIHSAALSKKRSILLQELKNR